MTEQHNGGRRVENWTPPERPSGLVLNGRFARLEPLLADRHAADLHRANSADRDGAIWRYLPYGPFSSVSAYHHWIRDITAEADPYFMALIDRQSDKPVGVLSLMRINPEHGVIEVGHINFSPALQRSTAASEAIYLLMNWVFISGYRRFEWKCDANNLRSRRAAERFGFSFEGVFRQHMVLRGRNRDTAWFAATDTDWPALKEAWEAWLAPANFDDAGRQIERLSDLTRLVRVSSDPALQGA